MRLRWTAIVVMGLVLAIGLPVSADGFSETGYNWNARIYNGTYDGIDHVLDGLYFGEPLPYINDHVVMKWWNIIDRQGGGTDEDGVVITHTKDGTVYQFCTSSGCYAIHWVTKGQGHAAPYHPGLGRYIH